MNERSRPEGRPQSPAKKTSCTIPPGQDSNQIATLANSRPTEPTEPHSFVESPEDLALCALCSLPPRNGRHRLPAPPVGLRRAIESARGDRWWWSCARTALRAAADSGRPFEAYDLERVYHCPPPSTPSAWGALLRDGKQAGLIEEAGFAPSSRPTRAGGVTRIWRKARGR